jgi:hypothetical protein
MADYVFGVFAFVTSVFSVIEFFGVRNLDWRNKAVHASYGAVLALLALLALHLQASARESQREIDELQEIERAAVKIVDNRPGMASDGDNEGYMLAALAFLEKYKPRFPDTYRRAEAVFETASAPAAKDDLITEEGNRLDRGADAMDALLRGIAGRNVGAEP